MSRTNFDAIKDMSVEEMAKLFSLIETNRINDEVYVYMPHKRNPDSFGSFLEAKEWLESEVEE